MDSIKILASKEEITPIADEIRQLNGTTELMGLNTMINNLDEVNNKINTQATKLDELKTILADKAGGSGSNSNKFETCTVTITDTNTCNLIYYTLDDNDLPMLMSYSFPFAIPVMFPQITCIKGSYLIYGTIGYMDRKFLDSYDISGDIEMIKDSVGYTVGATFKINGDCAITEKA